jgi:hypothetical protein
MTRAAGRIRAEIGHRRALGSRTCLTGTVCGVGWPSAGEGLISTGQATPALEEAT